MSDAASPPRPAWPPAKDELERLVAAHGELGAARIYGVSRSTLRYQCARLGVRSPHPRGTSLTVRRGRGEGPAPPPAPPQPSPSPASMAAAPPSRSSRELSSLQAVLDTIREIVPPLVRRDVPLYSVPVGDGDPEEAVALVSDQQIGQFVDPARMGGLGAYSRELFELRAQRWARKIMRIARLHQRAYPIRRLHLWFLGDNTEGVLVYRGQAWHVDTEKLQQLMFGVYVFAQAITSLLQVFERIEIAGILGNHGREGKRGEAPLTDNSDILFYYILSLQLANYRDRISWHVPPAHWTIREVLGHRFLLIHGDEIKSSLAYGIPFYGVNRADAGYTKMLASIRESYEYLVLGHFHNAGAIDSPTGEEIVNGSWVGGNEYSMREKRLVNRPVQHFFGVHAKQGITWRYKLNLYEPGDEKIVPSRLWWPEFGTILPREGERAA
ncbi:MAG: hypothetical protein AB1609_12655 [Bacillota bacterium]